MHNSIKDRYYVDRITYDDCKEWLLYKHYAKRMPSISYSFGLFDNDKIIQGVCTFGVPANYMEVKMWEPFGLLELNRVVMNDGHEKNLLSYFISKCMKKLSSNVIISYSDTEMNHYGYIYQACNFYYTGIGSIGEKIIVLKDGSEIHQRHFYEKDKNDIKEIKKTKGKARYYYFIGTKKEKKEMLNKLRYQILPYPKGDNKKYDASYQPTIQGRLF